MENLIQKDKPLYPEILWNRPVYSYSKSAGKLLIIAGSGTESEDALLTAESSFQSGTGVLTLAFPQSLEKSYRSFIPKEMLLPLPETPSRSISLKSKELINDFSEANNVDIIGPGLSKNSETTQLIWELIHELKGIQIISGDGVRALIMGLKLLFDKEKEEGVTNYFLKKRGTTIILLTNEELKKLDLKKEGNLNNLAKMLNSTIILFDNDIYLTDGETEIRTVMISNTTDKKSTNILAGILGSFVAQNQAKKLEAAATAIFLYKKATENNKAIPLKNLKAVMRGLENH